MRLVKTFFVVVVFCIVKSKLSDDLKIVLKIQKYSLDSALFCHNCEGLDQEKCKDTHYYHSQVENLCWITEKKLI